MTWGRHYRQIALDAPAAHWRCYWHWTCENGAWSGQRIRVVGLGLLGLLLTLGER